MHHRLSKQSRLIILGLNILLLAVYFFPIWMIQLKAPQYPEGLELKIMINRIGGQLDIINDLNHYIGMKVINPNDILELKLMPYILAVIILIGVLVWKRGSNWWFTTWMFLLVVAGSVGLMDFYKWEYDYGHHLDPHAAINIPGMTYQPPFWGTKQLLNFTSTSYPGIGGLALMSAATFAFIRWCLVFIPLLRRKHHIKKMILLHERLKAAAIFIGLLFLFSCNSSVVPLNYHEDTCNYCNMQLVDNRFGCECITQQGKVYKFDSFECLVGFLEKSPDLLNANTKLYTTDFTNPGHLIDARNAQYLISKKIHSPMGMGVASFSRLPDEQKTYQEVGGLEAGWNKAKSSVSDSLKVLFTNKNE